MRCLIISAALLAALPGMALADAQSTSPDESELTHFTGDVDGVVAWRRMDNTGFWSPVEHSMPFGVQGDFGLAPYMVRGEAGMQYSRKQADDASGASSTATLWDFMLGARVAPQLDIPQISWFHPYIGAGMIIVHADYPSPATTSVSGDGGTAVGIYGHAGLAVVLARHVHLGVDYRLVRGTSINLSNVQGDANNEEASAFVGYSW